MSFSIEFVFESLHLCAADCSFSFCICRLYCAVTMGVMNRKRLRNCLLKCVLTTYSWENPLANNKGTVVDLGLELGSQSNEGDQHSDGSLSFQHRLHFL